MSEIYATNHIHLNPLTTSKIDYILIVHSGINIFPM